ncbi:MAG: hypothetical protein ACI4TW_00585, partial [Prevotella sp.]
SFATSEDAFFITFSLQSLRPRNILMRSARQSSLIIAVSGYGFYSGHYWIKIHFLSVVADRLYHFRRIFGKYPSLHCKTEGKVWHFRWE